MASKATHGVNVSWETASTWSSGVAPNSADDAVVGSGSSVFVAANDIVASATIGDGATLTVNPGAALQAGTVFLNGTLKVAGTLQNSNVLVVGSKSVLDLTGGKFVGSSRIAVGPGGYLSIVQSDVNGHPSTGIIQVTSGTLDLTQMKGVGAAGVALMDSSAKLVVDGLNGGTIYGFKAGNTIDFAARTSGSATGRPVVMTLSDGTVLVTANGLAYTLYGESANATYASVSDGNGGYLLTTTGSATVPAFATALPGSVPLTATPLGSAAVTTSGRSAVWETAGTWSSGVAPGTKDDVVLNAGSSVAISANEIVGSVAVSAGATLTVKSGVGLQAANVFLNGTLQVAGRLYNSNVIVTGGTSVLDITNGEFGGSSQVAVGPGGYLSLVQSNVHGLSSAGPIQVTSGTLDLTQFKGNYYASVALIDSGAKLVVDGQYGADIYGFKSGNVIDFVPRTSGGVTAKPTVVAKPDGSVVVTANGQDYTLYDESAGATYGTAADGRGGYLLTTTANSSVPSWVTTPRSTASLPAETVTAAPANGLCGFVNGTTNQSGTIAMDAAGAGGPAYLKSQYIYAGSDNLALSTTQANVFLHSGTGNDAIQVTSGQNVLDGGLGSNFMTGGSGTDTFFTDARTAGAVWNTMINFHSGDAATLWGFVPGVSSYTWDSAVSGAAGAQGATLRANIVGGAGRTGTGVDASITFAGLSVAQGKALQIVTGTQPGGSYLYLYAP